MSKIIEIKIGYPIECPHRRTVSIPNTDGYFKYVCNENCEINCKNDYFFPENCHLKDEE